LGSAGLLAQSIFNAIRPIPVLRLPQFVSALLTIGYLFTALNNDESRGKFTASIYECQFPRADAGAHAGGGG